MAIKFKTKLHKIKTWTILHLPEDASGKLPTRGMVMVKGTVNKMPFKTLLEPDGRYGSSYKPSHWFALSRQLLDEIKAKAGDIVSVVIEPTKEWVEPDMPIDVKNALKSSAKAMALWKDITPLARWDWIRWIRAVKSEETRSKHIEIMLDKLNKGIRRPCCFNRNLCSEPYVSKNWVLMEPEA